jgi:hypothetical protein
LTDDIRSGITLSMGRYLREHPSQKYLFFGGKGGVGKTVFAAAAAIGLARQGRRVLLASTNPVHSLTSLLGQDVLGRHVPVAGAPNLCAACRCSSACATPSSPNRLKRPRPRRRRGD